MILIITKLLAKRMDLEVHHIVAKCLNGVIGSLKIKTLDLSFCR